MTRTCTCGADISTRPDWQSLCYPCWLTANPHRAHGAARRYASGQPLGPQPRADQYAERAQDAEAVRATAAENLRLQRQVQDLMAARDAAVRETNYALLQLRTLRATKATPTPTGMGERLNKLVRLCHPDKHGNSPMANEVTAWLLGLRGKV